MVLATRAWSEQCVLHQHLFLIVSVVIHHFLMLAFILHELSILRLLHHRMNFESTYKHSFCRQACHRLLLLSPRLGLHMYLFGHNHKLCSVSKHLLWSHVCLTKKPEWKADSTLRSSQAVPHPSTDRALRCLTSEVKRDPVHSTRYGRRRKTLFGIHHAQMTNYTFFLREVHWLKPSMRFFSPSPLGGRGLKQARTKLSHVMGVPGTAVHWPPSFVGRLPVYQSTPTVGLIMEIRHDFAKTWKVWDTGS